VTVEFVAGHLEEIIDRVNKGALLVQQSADKLVGADDLRALAAAYRGETVVAAPDGPYDEPYGDEEGGYEDEPQGEMYDDMPPESPEGEPDFSDGDFPSDEGQDQYGDEEPEEPSEDMPDESGEDYGGDMMEMASAKPERSLPEGFEKLSRKKLLALCKERGIAVPEKGADSAQLVKLLSDWVKGN